jgi:hypothetical protein
MGYKLINPGLGQGVRIEKLEELYCSQGVAANLKPEH